MLRNVIILVFIGKEGLRHSAIPQYSARLEAASQIAR